jgi:hypothetical protein
VTRKRFESSDSVDASNRLVCTHRSTRYRAECHFAVGPLELAKCFRAMFKFDHCLLGWRSICSDFFLPIERLNWGRLIRGVWQRATAFRIASAHNSAARTSSDPLGACADCSHIGSASQDSPWGTDESHYSSSRRKSKYPLSLSFSGRPGQTRTADPLLRSYTNLLSSFLLLLGFQQLGASAFAQRISCEGSLPTVLIRF